MSDASVHIERLEPVLGSSSWVRVVLDCGEVVMVTLATWADLGLKVGQLLNGDGVVGLRRAGDLDGALETAIRYLRTKPRTSVEIESHLRAKGTAPDTLALVTTRLRERGWLDDEAYARAFIDQYQSTLSRREIVFRLQRRGISTIPTAAMAEAETDMEYIAAATAAGKFLRSHAKDDADARWRKLAGHLQRRGFAASVIHRVLKEVRADRVVPPDVELDP